MRFVGIGNALLDLAAAVEEGFPPRCGFHTGMSSHVSTERAEEVAKALGRTCASAGGGAANAARVAAALGAEASFVGMVGGDARGRHYRDDLDGAGVKVLLGDSPHPTGLFLALVEPGSRRTVVVAPGAAVDLGEGDVPEAAFANGGILYLEGFLAARRDFLSFLAARGAEAGMTVVLDVGSYALARRESEFFLALLEGPVDLAFMNEDEFHALTGTGVREGLPLLAADGLEVVVKRAERGAIWAGAGDLIESPVRAIEAVDETGAGDAFAAGFLCARDLGLAPERALRAANRVAGEVVRELGCSPDPERLRRAFDSVAWS